MSDDYKINKPSGSIFKRSTAPKSVQAQHTVSDEISRRIHEHVHGASVPQEMTPSQLNNLTEDQWEFIRACGKFKTQDIDMIQTLELAKFYAGGHENVLITGETGNGKELVARMVHGARPSKQFIAINCAGFTDTLFESELFGYKKGSHSTAMEDRIGKVELATGGTLFLDEIGEMALPLQAKLLRLIESREYYPVGSVELRKANCRFVFATNVDLEQAVKHKRFRADLLYRINTLHLHIKPLRDRPGDVRLIAEVYCHTNDDKHEPLREDEIPHIPYADGGVREILNWLTRRKYASKRLLPADPTPDINQPDMNNE